MHRALSPLRKHPWFATAAVVLVVLAGVGFMNRTLVRAWFSEDVPVDFELPVASPVGGTGGTVYAIDAAESAVVVSVEEELAGKAKTVELSTKSIAGQIRVDDPGSPKSVTIGEIVVGVDQLRSDNNLRDKVLQHEYLESHTNRQVRLLDAELDSSSIDGTEITSGELDATLELKGEPFATTWSVDAELEGDSIRATATTTVTMSELGIGPITKAGLVRTSNDVTLTIDIVATKGHTPPAGLVSQSIESVAATSVDDVPSFSTDIQPVLEANCASCHAQGELGGAMWTLAVARDAAQVADGLAVVTESGYMPPWPASDLGVELAHARGLSAEDIEAIASWAEAGAPLDVDPMTRIRVPEEPLVPQPRADVVVKMSEPYKGTPDQLDDYRCFILDPEVTEPTFLTGYTFDPDQLGTVHHAIVTRVRAAELGRIREKDDADYGPGWGCLAGMGSGLGDRVAGWVPGQDAVKFVSGDGFDMQPGDVLVAQIHYHYNPGVPADQSGMTLEFTSDPTITAIESQTLIGPVELPCTAEMEGPLCDRDAAVQDVSVRFGPGAPGIANGLHFVCRSTIEEQRANFDGRHGATTCDFTVRRPGNVIGMLAHMHEIGSSYRMTLHPDTADETVLLDIPTWNFGWQLGYRPVEEIRLERGDTIRVRCEWDRALRHETVPRYIVFAEGTEDEMCYTALTVRPD